MLASILANENVLDDIEYHGADITSQNINFQEMKKDLKRFASEPSVQEVLEKGVDLQNYNKKIAEELHKLEEDSINDYIRQQERVTKIHSDIQNCQTILTSMDELVSGFRGKLNILSMEISSMQTKSQEVRTKLNNRVSLDKYLSEFTDKTSLTPQFSKSILQGEIGPKYITILQHLEQKITFINRPENRTSPAAQENLSQLQSLAGKACNIIQRWVSLKTDLLVNDYETHLSIQNSMARCRYLIQFVKVHSSSTFQDIEDLYASALSKLSLDIYKKETSRFEKQMAIISTSKETIIPQAASTSRFAKSKRVPGESTLFFSLGDREKILDDVLAPPIEFSPDQKLPIELLLRSLYVKLIDSVTPEFAFCSDFFGDEKVPNSIFSETLYYLENFLNNFIPKITDPVCMVILIRLCMAHGEEMEKRNIHILDSHFNKIRKLFEIRFNQIIDFNLAAIESFNAATIVPKTQSSKLGPMDTSHMANSMTKRYAEFATSLSILLNDKTMEIVLPALHKISAAVTDLLERAHFLFVDHETGSIFLINNYALILATLNRIENCLVLELFQSKLNDVIMHFVDQELQLNFPKIVDIVRHAFSKLENNEEPCSLAFGENELKEAALDFQTNHIETMTKISESMFLKFGDFQNSLEILSQLAKRLVLYWAKFDQLCRATFKNGPVPKWFKSLISKQQLVCNIKPLINF